jgi:hypothetical protein
LVPRSRRAVIATGVSALILVGACGGRTNDAVEPVAHGSVRKGAGPAARDVCSDMVRESVPSSVGLPLAGEPVQAVRGDTFSCRYLFDGGALDLSVRDLHTLRDARTYFRGLRAREGVQDALPGLSEGGFTRTDGSVVAIKDAMILTVDVTELPPTETQRSNVAIEVAATVLGCW